MPALDVSIPVVSDNSLFQSKYAILHDLMPFKVREILLVSSLYDQFILEEDGILAERIIAEYQSLNLSFPPRVTRVSSGIEALNLLETKHFDLVITMTRLMDIDPFKFGQNVKKINPDIPVILLLANAAEQERLPPQEQQKGIDFLFVWNGDSSIFLAIIKIIEDLKNVQHDVELGFVRVIILIEDTPIYYSMFLPLMYKEVMRETQRLVAEGVNQAEKLLRMRIRPKILLATSYEQAMEYVEKYQDFLLGVISDVGFPYHGKKDAQAGFTLVEELHQKNPYLPILIQSSDKKNEAIAKELGVKFLHKRSHHLLYQLRAFIQENLGLGSFVFRMPNGEIIATAETKDELIELIKTVPGESLYFHGSQNHFSSWLFAKGDYELAYSIRPVKVTDFKDTEELRAFLLKVFEESTRKRYQGVIADFSKEGFDSHAIFTRLGRGSLGGKGRGLAFITILLANQEFKEKYPDVEISIPQTIVISTEYFDKFMEENNLIEAALSEDISDEELKELFVSRPLPSELRDALTLILHKIDTPIAVRSSSLLEDSQFQPFAGIYTTYMLPNNHPDLDTRLRHLEEAIKLVYASIYTKLAKSYIKTIGQQVEVEKMAIVIQKIVGKKHENRYYPDFSGVAQSINYYPISYMKPEDGIATIALGLGAMIVEGGQVLSFSPKYPKLLPQASTPKMALDATQKEFYALNLSKPNVNLLKGENATLELLPITIAQKDGSLTWLASKYDYQNDRMLDSMKSPGVPVLTFAPILKHERFPLTKIINDLLDLSRRAFAAPVEIEFAVLLDYEEEKHHEFRILQIRPMVDGTDRNDENIDCLKEEAIIFSSKVLGNGIFNNIQDIVYVRPDTFDTSKTRDIALEIHNINQELAEEAREYVLIGPGRWGTQDPFLGIPVNWGDINFARAIVETTLPDFVVDPSQGMHFFVNITSTRRAYFTVSHKSKEDFLNWAWLEGQKTHCSYEYVRHIRLNHPVSVRVNGRKGKGAVIIQPIEKTDEEDE